MKPHDLIVLKGRTWKVQGVYLGGSGQESVVGLLARDMAEPTARGEAIEEMFVPLSIIEAACGQNVLQHYTRVDKGATHG